MTPQCPRCERPRVGAFRFCLVCGHDYEPRPAPTRTAPTVLTAAGASSTASEPVHGRTAADPPPSTEPPVSPPYTVPVEPFEPLDRLAAGGPPRWIEQAGEPTRPAGPGPIKRAGPEATQDPAGDPLPTMFNESERAASDAEEDLSLGATIVLGMLAVSVVGAVAFAVVQILRWIGPG